MIKVYGFGENLGLADPSPFVLKVMTYLKMSGIDFESVASFGNLRKAPKSKLPFIEDDGEIIADSTLIFKYLKSKYGASIDERLSHEQKALAHLIIKSLDENFYWAIVYSRWVRDQSWPETRERFFGAMPFPIKHIAPMVARKGTITSLQKHGMGKHSDEEIMNIADDTLSSLSTVLGDTDYFWGDSPTSLDATVFAFVAQLALSEMTNDFTQLMAKYPNLITYCQRIQNTYF